MQDKNNYDGYWDRPIAKWVPHMIRCKCGTVIVNGFQLHTDDFIFPTQVIEFSLCENCRRKPKTFGD